MSVIIQNNSTFSISDITARHEKLPVGVYLLKYDADRGTFYLHKTEEFKLPRKVYGDHSSVDRWLHSFESNSEKNLGVLLSGIRGSGKTVTAQKLCIDSGLPIIIMTEPYSGPAFVEFITSPNLGKFVLFIDEFEKVYNTAKDAAIQDTLLSLMDGMFQTNILFLLTVNQDRLSENLTNRPGRIKYRKHYTSLTDEEMFEVAGDLLQNGEYIDSIPEFFNKVGMCTYDLLISVIKEMNLFNQDAITCGRYMNLIGTPKSYKIYEIRGEKEYELGTTHRNLFTGDALWVDRNECDDNDDNYWGEGSNWIQFQPGSCTIVKDGPNVIATNLETQEKVKFVEMLSSSQIF